MKIMINTDSDTLFLLKACSDLYRKNDMSHVTTREQKSAMYLFFELRAVFTRKAVSCTGNNRTHRITLPYYLANTMYDFICDQLTFNAALGVYERNKIEIIRNELHQKLL